MGKGRVIYMKAGKDRKCSMLGETKMHDYMVRKFGG
jgi:hypothetical protein